MAAKQRNKKAKRGRPSAYETIIRPRFAEIGQWLAEGATEKECIDNLGISRTAWYDAKKQYTDFADVIKKARKKPVQAIKAALFRRATGFTYSETKTVYSDRNGQTVETVEKYALPDPTAAMMLLKHWDDETEWTADPARLRLQKQELELKKQQIEKEDW